jgi:hypothetical protein
MSMRRVTLLCLALSALAAGAETLPEPTGPEELVLPPIVLEVEDLSEVHVEARLPPEADLVPPDRRFPLPDPGVLAISEPAIPSIVPAGSGGTGQGTGGPLTAVATLGAGTLRGLSADVRLSATGTPDLQASFAHDALDGFGGHPPGDGFDLRDDELAVSVALHPWSTDLEIEGTWKDSARGLQDHGGNDVYASLTERSIGTSVSLSGTPVAWLELAGGLEVADNELVLAGPVPYEVSELGVAPSLSATAAFGRWSIGLAARYDFHAGELIADPFADGHRFRTDLTTGVELAPGWQIEAAVGWHWTSEGLSTFPFHIGLTGSPLPFLTFSLRGGYQAVPVDLADVLAAHVFLLPDTTVDSEGWFGAVDMTLGAGGTISATAGLSYSAESKMLDADGSVDVDSQDEPLYPVFQLPADRLTLTGGLRWSIAAWLTLNASLVVNLPYRPWWEPAVALDVELTALESSGRMGATLSAAADAFSSDVELPRLNVGAFLRVSPTVRLRLDASDLLGPLAGPRTDLGIFERPGLRVTGTVQLEL